MDIVRNTDLPALLTVLGYQVTKIGHYHSTKEMGKQPGGLFGGYLGAQHYIAGKVRAQSRNAFTAGRYKETMDRFNSQARAPPQSSISTHKSAEKEKIPFVLPTKSTDHRRVFAYLRKRGIAKQPSGLFGGYLGA